MHRLFGEPDPAVTARTALHTPQGEDSVHVWADRVRHAVCRLESLNQRPDEATLIFTVMQRMNQRLYNRIVQDHPNKQWASYEDLLSEAKAFINNEQARQAMRNLGTPANNPSALARIRFNRAQGSKRKAPEPSSAAAATGSLDNIITKASGAVKNRHEAFNQLQALLAAMAPKANTKTNAKDKVCPHCGKKGHTSMSNEHCLLHAKWLGGLTADQRAYWGPELQKRKDEAAKSKAKAP